MKKALGNKQQIRVLPYIAQQQIAQLWPITSVVNMAVMKIPNSKIKHTHIMLANARPKAVVTA